MSPAELFVSDRTNALNGSSPGLANLLTRNPAFFEITCVLTKFGREPASFPKLNASCLARRPRCCLSAVHPTFGERVHTTGRKRHLGRPTGIPLAAKGIPTAGGGEALENAQKSN